MDGAKPERIEPLKVRLREDEIPIREKQWRYPSPKRDFLTKYCRLLIQLGFVEPVTSTEWVSAPLVVLKRPPENYRLKIDYRSVNSATVPNFCPMPNIEAELSDVRAATVFSGIYFFNRYWKFTLHPESQPLSAFMTPPGVVMTTRTTQGG